MNSTPYISICTKHPANLRECPFCHLDERLSDGCEIPNAWNGSGSYCRIPHALEADGRCPTCRALPGRYHHAGCDEEKCPCGTGKAMECLCVEDYRKLVPWLLQVVRVFVQDMPDGPLGQRAVGN